ncbi:MAG: NYN domain-containing protein [Myxococcales bacterium]|nr:NYN domain-containing protein [Myxococcales bacterium]
MSEPRVALLIDADNTSGTLAAAVVAEAARHGRLVIRRMYGDWTTTALQKWKAVVADHAIQPMQQFANTAGKNSTDSALIIDAMDLLHGDAADVFCIASSDADFTRLASRLRENAKVVVGIGHRQTPKAFVQACERFVFVENLVSAMVGDAAEPTTKAASIRTGSPSKTGRGNLGRIPNSARAKLAASADGPALARGVVASAAAVSPEVPAADLQALLAKAYDNAEEDAGFANLGKVGNQLVRLDPSFDSRTFGYRQLRQLVAAQAGYRIEIQSDSGNLVVIRDDAAAGL